MWGCGVRLGTGHLKRHKCPRRRGQAVQKGLLIIRLASAQAMPSARHHLPPGAEAVCLATWVAGGGKCRHRTSQRRRVRCNDTAHKRPLRTARYQDSELHEWVQAPSARPVQWRPEPACCARVMVEFGREPLSPHPKPAFRLPESIPLIAAGDIAAPAESNAQDKN